MPVTKYPAVMVWKSAKNLGVGFDMNTLNGGSGFYEVDTPTNGPGTGVWFVEVQYSGVDGKVLHKAMQKGVTGKGYTRTYSGSAWSGWVQGGSVGNKAAPAAYTVSATVASADLIAGWATVNQGGAAPSVLTLPTGSVFDTAYLAAYPGAQVGDYIDFSLINLSVVDAEDATLTAASGFTIVGNAVVEGKSAQFANASGIFRLRRVAADSWTAYRIS